ncbi:hypothetical protein ACSFA2_25165 [Variovorax sp. LT2P21]|uniref:hypothetical protein n=1 Tax=Variovorax sp. LT2P21 TaxID=3443731 RepID=UPI003F479BC8
MNKFAVPFVERKEIYQFSYDLAHKEYADIWEAWKLLEAKAQATLATAGIFEAGAFAYITQAKPTDTASKIMLTLLVIVLAAAVAYGVQAIRIRDFNTPFLSKLHKDIRGTIERSQPTDSLSDLHAQWLIEATVLCTAANDKLRPKLDEKGKRLKRALGALLMASFLVVPLVACTLFFQTDPKTTEPSVPEQQPQK